jgi:hypothetical protein
VLDDTNPEQEEVKEFYDEMRCNDDEDVDAIS